jgi:branched-chain amino acid transport system ATP-binding protein
MLPAGTSHQRLILAQRCESTEGRRSGSGSRGNSSRQRTDRRITRRKLSGGEQQMLAIGRALMTNPILMILDEATEGLAPLIRKEIWTRLCALKAMGLSLILIDKDLQALVGIADRHYILEKGTIVWTGTSSELLSDAEMQRKFLSV